MNTQRSPGDEAIRVAMNGVTGRMGYNQAGVKAGVVQDKLLLSGLRALKSLIEV